MLIIDFLNYFYYNYSKIIDYTAAHLALILISIFFSLLIWISTGILIRDKKNYAKSIFAVGSFIMAVPSVSLYGILMSLPLLGLSRKSAVLALVLYSMIPIVRNVYTALNEVDDSVVESARGMGMTEKQILWKIKMPIALPIITAGIRVALVMMVGTASMAVFIGERNLGQLIYQGIVRSKTEMIAAGAVLIVLISITADIIINSIEKMILSPGLLEDKND